jgi:hypothetical protein
MQHNFVNYISLGGKFPDYGIECANCKCPKNSKWAKSDCDEYITYEKTLTGEVVRVERQREDK